ncbi:MAG TPA: class I adenylate-forming enzyme family protein [Chthoniobacterales bacterium]|nr:class I adenylate-forming enzyme family protein [Chthoniobacterales bacterium]
MNTEDPLLIAWENTRARANERPAIVATTGQVLQTFGQIESRSRELERLGETNAVGSVIAIQIGNHQDWPALLIACLRRGLVVLPLEQLMSEQQRDVALNVCDASLLVTSRDGKLEIAQVKAAAGKARPHLSTLLKLTSGTTAAPRIIRFRSDQLLADCNQICQTMGISDSDLNFGVIPISHSYGFSNLLTPLVARAVPMVLSNDPTPRAVLADLARTNATVLPATPFFYQSFCEIGDAPALPKLRLCISAGAPLSITVAKNFRGKFQLPIHSFYGASECGGICYDRDGTNEIEGFVGAPMENVDIEMLDPASDSSQVRIRSAAVGDGYFPDPDSDKLGEGIFVPDDLLARAGAGFKIVGRTSDLINVAGKKVNPAEIEAYLRHCRGVREAVVFGLNSVRRNEEVAACVVGEDNLRENELLESARRTLSPWQVPKRIFIVDTIPANERGKISRRELAKRFAK